MTNFLTLMKEFEKKYQQKWSDAKVFDAEVDENKEKFYLIWAYPGVSGYMHVGHMRGYSYLDAIARYKRMQGYNVLFPVGVHTSGLPTVGFSLKVKNKEESTINYLLENNCPPDFIPKLADPLVAIDYFSKEYVDIWKGFGFTVDLQYFINTISPEYKKFIEWQFKKLSQLNLLVRKPHYAPWCPIDGPIAVDPSETDIAQGGDAEQIEFILAKFKAEWIEDNTFFVTGTLRPETIYGVTNIWLNPKETYSLIEIEKEKWIVSEACANSMKLGEKPSVLKTFKGSDLLGKLVYNAATTTEVPILPGDFVDINLATGVVMSVPAHAPYDWIALKDLLESNQDIHDIVKTIQPISLIDSPLGKFSAQEACKKYNITSQEDIEALKRATEEVYKVEFHKGVLTITEFAGMNISDAKDVIVDTLIEREIFSSLKIHEFSKEVICRCGSKVSIRMIPNQWFIRYSDENLKEKSKFHTEVMNIYPDQYKSNISAVIDWYEDRACARQGKWLGTALPQDREWIIEPISDSTLYPIFYIIAKFVNSDDIAIEHLTEEFFDYVFLEKGNSHEICDNIGIEQKLLDEIKQAVEYWYPLDLNLGGKEHQTVHFPVFVMNHIALLKPTFWPKGIFVNYWVNQQSDPETNSNSKQSKLSKSKGGAKPVHQYMVDGLRLYYAHSKSAHQDVEWDPQTVEIYNRHLNKIYDLYIRIIESLSGVSKKDRYSELDMYLLSKMNRIVKDLTDWFDQTINFRKISQEIFYTIYNMIIHYLNRGGSNSELLRNTLQTWVSLICPFAPHIAEELWSLLDLEGFVSNSTWPKMDETKIVSLVEAKEEYLLNVLSDINNIARIRKTEEITEIEITVTPNWKEEILNDYLADKDNLLSRIMEKEHIKVKGNLAVQYAKKLLKSREKMVCYFDRETELEIIQNARKYIESITKSTIKVRLSEKSDSPKKNQAEPFRPAIYIQ